MLQTTSSPRPSMNEPHDQDPFNNSSYGTLVDAPYKLVSLPVLDVLDFNERIIRGYEDGSAEKGLPADLSLARSLVPAGTATLRDFSNIAPEIPLYIPENCTGCMDCVTQCPDTAILGKVLSETELEERLATIAEPADREMFRAQWSRTKKYFDAPKKKGLSGRDVQHHHRPQQVQGVRRVRHDLRRQRPEDGRQDRRGDDHRAEEPPLFQELRPEQRTVRQRQPAHRHDAQGADPHLHRRRRLVRGLRRGDGLADDVRGDRLEVRRPVGHRRRHGVQHGLHLDLSLQPLPRSLDQLAVRERAGLRHRRADAMGPDGLAGPAALVPGRRRRHVRHRLPGALPAAGQRHEHQGVRARHPGLFQHRRPGLHQQLHRPEHQDERARQGPRRQARAAQGDRPDRHDAPADLRGPDHLCAHEPLLPVGAGRARVRRPGDRRLLHDLPARARRGRQHGRRAGPARRRQPCVSAPGLRSPQGKHHQGTSLPAGQPGRPRTTGTSTPRPRSPSRSSISPAARAGSPSTSTATATPPRRSCEPRKTGSRTGISSRSWQG